MPDSLFNEIADRYAAISTLRDLYLFYVELSERIRTVNFAYKVDNDFTLRILGFWERRVWAEITYLESQGTFLSNIPKDNPEDSPNKNNIATKSPEMVFI